MLENLDKKELIQIIEKLEKENNELKEKIYGKIEEKEIERKTKDISSEEKVKIFMEIFKGRTDLYAKRWTSNKTGKSGYSPVCKNEFSTYKCDKIKKSKSVGAGLVSAQIMGHELQKKNKYLQINIKSIKK